MPAADTPSSPALTASAAEVPDRLTHLLLVREIEEFLFHEANLLDGRQFSAWLDLLTEDIRYFMPMRRNVRHSDQARADTREGKDINWFDEDKFTLQQRVRQIETGVHWAEEPLSRTTHMVSNVTIAEAGTGHGEIQVDLRFLLYRNRLIVIKNIRAVPDLSDVERYAALDICSVAIAGMMRSEWERNSVG